MDNKKKGIVKHKRCMPCLCCLSEKLSACNITNNKKIKFTIDSSNLVIPIDSENLNKKENLSTR
jgi:hypothetical protein